MISRPPHLIGLVVLNDFFTLAAYPSDGLLKSLCVGEKSVLIFACFFGLFGPKIRPNHVPSFDWSVVADDDEAEALDAAASEEISRFPTS